VDKAKKRKPQNSKLQKSDQEEEFHRLTPRERRKRSLL